MSQIGLLRFGGFCFVLCSNFNPELVYEDCEPRPDYPVPQYRHMKFQLMWVVDKESFNYLDNFSGPPPPANDIQSP